MSANLYDYLAERRTIPAAQLSEPGPDRIELEKMLTVAARVPDHGKLAPWRFIVFDKDARAPLANWMIARGEAAGGPTNAEKYAERARRFADAPMVVAIVSTAASHPKIPEWEQVLSAGAVCLNLLHAANSLGYSAQWLTDWFTYDEVVGDRIGLEPGERIAGFVHIGTPTAPPTERSRPDVSELTTYWED